MCTEAMKSKSSCQDRGLATLCITVPDLPHSPLPRIEGTNYIPSETERQIANAAALEARRKLTFLGDQISRIDELMDDIFSLRKMLSDRHDEMKKFCHEYQRISSCTRMRELAPEILSKIFIYHQDWLLSDHWSAKPRPRDSQPADEGDSFSLASGPLLLTSVCQRWREVALAIPHIWATIKYIEKPGNSSKVGELVNLWAIRAADVPLHVYIGEAYHWRIKDSLSQGLNNLFTSSMNNFLSPMFPTEKPGCLPDAISRLLDLAERWEKVHIASPGLHFERSWQRFSSIKGRLPLLRYLTLESWLEPSKGILPFNGDVKMDLFCDAPLLVSINIMHWPGFLSSAVFPYNQLKKLTTTAVARHSTGHGIPDLNMTLGILTRCNILEEFSMTCGPWISHLPYITHSRLNYLFLRISEHADDHLFIQIAFPALQSLVIDTLCLPACDAIPDDLQSFLQRSPKLSALSIRSRTISNAFIGGCVVGSPGLKLFSIAMLKECFKVPDGIAKHLNNLHQTQWPAGLGKTAACRVSDQMVYMVFGDTQSYRLALHK